MDPIAMINDILKFFEGLKKDSGKKLTPRDAEILAEVNGIAAASGIPGATMGDPAHGGHGIITPPNNAVIGIDIKSMIFTPKGLIITLVLAFVGYKIYEHFNK